MYKWQKSHKQAVQNELTEVVPLVLRFHGKIYLTVWQFDVKFNLKLSEGEDKIWSHWSLSQDWWLHVIYVKIQIFCDRSFTWFLNYFFCQISWNSNDWIARNRQVSAKAINLNFLSNCTCAVFNWVLLVTKKS